MHLLKSSYRAVLRAVLCLFQWVFIPLAPVADDRIVAAREFARALGMWECQRQQKRYWSVLSLLRRAACRQEYVNRYGQQKLDELVARQWDRAFALKLHAVILLRFFAWWYGVEALAIVAHDHFPWLNVVIMETDKCMASLIHSFWNLLPGSDV